MCNRCKDESRLTSLKYILKNYGLSIDDYHDLLAQQKGLCAVCGYDDKNNGTTLYIDHNHFTDKVRGLLCPTCNASIAGIDNSKDLRKCLEYSFQNYVPSSKKLVADNELLKNENATLKRDNERLKKLYEVHEIKVHRKRIVSPELRQRYRDLMNARHEAARAAKGVPRA